MKYAALLILLGCAVPLQAQRPVRALGPLYTARWESASCVTLIVRDPAPTAQVCQLRNVRITQNAVTLSVARLGLETRMLALLPRGWPHIPVRQHCIYLHLSTPVDETQPVQIALRGVRAPLVLPPLRDSAVQCIQVNSLGYQPDDNLKIARMGAWTGTGGPLQFGAHTAVFHVVDAAARSNAFSGVPILLASRDHASGACVYGLDFSPLRTPGRYYLHVPGVGMSVPFEITPAVYEPVLTTLLRALYHQRCGIALTPPHTTHTRTAPCHRTPALLVDFHHSLDHVMKDLPARVIKPERTIDGWGGWHDAGDYDRAGWHIFVVTELLDLFQMYPALCPDGALNIPESGNGVPDVLDEACWGLAWFVRMQDTNDGGLFYRIESADYGHVKPEDDRQQLYAMSKYPKYTAFFAAGAAQAARVLQPWITSNAYAELAGRAQRAYEYGVRHNAPVEALSRAAAELFLTTGSSVYHQAFIASGQMQSWSYAVSGADGVDAGAQRACRTWFLDQAARLAARIATNGYPVVNGGIGAGAGRAANLLMRAHYLSGDTNYLDMARLITHAQLGLNALRRSWITGVGVDPPEEVTHAPSVQARRVLPGLPIFGPHAWEAEPKTTHARVLWQVSSPHPYPWMRMYAPAWAIPSISEFTVRDIAEIALAYGALHAQVLPAD